MECFDLEGEKLLLLQLLQLLPLLPLPLGGGRREKTGKASGFGWRAGETIKVAVAIALCFKKLKSSVLIFPPFLMLPLLDKLLREEMWDIMHRALGHTIMGSVESSGGSSSPSTISSG